MKCLEFLHEQGLNPLEMRNHWSRWPDNVLHEFQVREEFIERFGFAILTDEAVEAIRPHAPLLELGAGSGYWTYELKQHGIDVIATDPGTERFGRFLGDKPGRWREHWIDIEKLDAIKAVQKYPERNLLLVWPSLSDSWATDSIKIFTGKTVIYVGEGSGGCTADETFHSLLDEQFPNQQFTPLPVFYGIHDRLVVATQ